MFVVLTVAYLQDLWGSTDSVASDSLASERSLSMESLAQVLCRGRAGRDVFPRLSVLAASC